MSTKIKPTYSFMHGLRGDITEIYKILSQTPNSSGSVRRIVHLSLNWSKSLAAFAI